MKISRLRSNWCERQLNTAFWPLFCSLVCSISPSSLHVQFLSLFKASVLSDDGSCPFADGCWWLTEHSTTLNRRRFEFLQGNRIFYCTVFLHLKFYTLRIELHMSYSINTTFNLDDHWLTGGGLGYSCQTTT